MRLRMPPITLRDRLLGPTQLVMTLLVIALAVGFLHREGRLEERNERRLAERAGRLVGQAAARSLERADSLGARQALEALRALPEIEQAWLLDPHGRIEAGYDRNRRGRPAGVDVAPRLLDAQLIGCPIECDGRPLGTVLLATGRTGISGGPQGDALILACGLLMALLISILISRGVFEAAAGRLARINDAASRLARGDLSARVDGAGNDEIGQLAQGFNTMAAAVESSNRELSKAYDELNRSRAEVERYASLLEVMVAERTRDLEIARDRAESASRAKSAFLASVSHEIRTPLNGMIGMADMLALTRLEDQQRQWTSGILACGETLLALIAEILDFAKIEAGRMELASERFQPAALARCCIQVLAGKAAQKELALQLRIEGDEEAWAVGDEQRIGQVLLNLLGNAVKFTDSGRIELSLGLTPAPDPSAYRIVFAVVDTGIGIPAEKLDRIFESFTQVDESPTRRHGGTGLGLAIARRLCDLMGGELTVASIAGQGSRFCFSLVLPAVWATSGTTAA